MVLLTKKMKHLRANETDKILIRCLDHQILTKVNHINSITIQNQKLTRDSTNHIGNHVTHSHEIQIP